MIQVQPQFENLGVQRIGGVARRIHLGSVAPSSPRPRTGHRRRQPGVPATVTAARTGRAGDSGCGSGAAQPGRRHHCCGRGPVLLRAAPSLARKWPGSRCPPIGGACAARGSLGEAGHGKHPRSERRRAVRRHERGASIRRESLGFVRRKNTIQKYSERFRPFQHCDASALASFSLVPSLPLNRPAKHAPPSKEAEQS